MNKAEITSWNQESITQGYAKKVSGDESSDLKINTQEYHDPYLWQLIGKIPEGRILDLGCGEGRLTQRILEQSKSSFVDALDIPSMTPITNDKLKNFISEKRAQAHSEYAQELPFEEDTFDLVVSSLMLHWTDNQDKILKETMRVLKPGGRTILTLAHPDTFRAGHYEENQNETIFVKNANMDTTRPEKEIDIFLSSDIGPLTYHRVPAADYEKMMQDSGFTYIKIDAPLVKDSTLINKYPHLNKHRENGGTPIYLFMSGTKQTI